MDLDVAEALDMAVKKNCSHRYVTRYRVAPWKPTWECQVCKRSLQEDEVIKAGFDPESMLKNIREKKKVDG
jgi:hypothetical protein